MDVKKSIKKAVVRFGYSRVALIVDAILLPILILFAIVWRGALEVKDEIWDWPKDWLRDWERSHWW